MSKLHNQGHKILKTVFNKTNGHHLNLTVLFLYVRQCAADFSLLNLPKGKSLGRSKPATNS